MRATAAAAGSEGRAAGPGAGERIGEGGGRGVGVAGRAGGLRGLAAEAVDVRRLRVAVDETVILLQSPSTFSGCINSDG